MTVIWRKLPKKLEKEICLMFVEHYSLALSKFLASAEEFEWSLWGLCQLRVSMCYKLRSLDQSTNGAHCYSGCHNQVYEVHALELAFN